MGKKGNRTHEHRAVKERMISRGFKERGNITVTTQRTLHDTNEISKKGANAGKSERRLMKTAGSQRMNGEEEEWVR